MDGSRVSDFSIERILSPQLGHKQPGRGRFPEAPAGFRPPAPAPVQLQVQVPVSVPVPVPVPDCLRYRVPLSCGEFCPFGPGFHQPEFSGIYPSPGGGGGVYLRFSPEPTEVQMPFAGYHGYHPAAVSCAQAQSQSRQKARVRTVFTDSQAKLLEALFDVTDYPAVEARAELARRAGLSEETVRVWFKNRRARRKRQRPGSKVRSPSPPHSAAADDPKLFSSFL